MGRPKSNLPYLSFGYKLIERFRPIFSNSLNYVFNSSFPLLTGTYRKSFPSGDFATHTEKRNDSFTIGFIHEEDRHVKPYWERTQWYTGFKGGEYYNLFDL